MFNSAWAEGCLPAEGKHAVIVPILKPGKYASSPSSYWPIGIYIISGHCKIIEWRANRLVYFLESKGLFAEGFGIESVAVLDIEKAYDSLWKEGLKIEMNDLGIRGRIFIWIMDFLMKRTTQVRVGRKGSKIVERENGAPQGRNISPVLFNIMINYTFGNVGRVFG